MEKKEKNCSCCGAPFSYSLQFDRYGWAEEFHCERCRRNAVDPLRRAAFVYCLIDPRDSLLRYIGTTVNPRERYIAHMSAHTNKAVRNDGLKSWIKGLRQEKLRPVMEILERVDKAPDGQRPEDYSYTRERYWIRTKELEGHPLLNINVKRDGKDRPIRPVRPQLSLLSRVRSFLGL